MWVVLVFIVVVIAVAVSGQSSKQRSSSNGLLMVAFYPATPQRCQSRGFCGRRGGNYSIKCSTSRKNKVKRSICVDCHIYICPRMQTMLLLIPLDRRSIDSKARRPALNTDPFGMHWREKA